MAVSMADITKLRKLSGAGMMDCKKALEEAAKAARPARKRAPKARVEKTEE